MKKTKTVTTGSSRPVVADCTRQQTVSDHQYAYAQKLLQIEFGSGIICRAQTDCNMALIHVMAYRGKALSSHHLGCMLRSILV